MCGLDDMGNVLSVFLFVVNGLLGQVIIMQILFFFELLMYCGVDFVLCFFVFVDGYCVWCVIIVVVLEDYFCVVLFCEQDFVDVFVCYCFVIECVVCCLFEEMGGWLVLFYSGYFWFCM